MAYYIITCIMFGWENSDSMTVVLILAPLAQLAERRSHNPEVVSSILTGSTTCLTLCQTGLFFSYSYFPTSFCQAGLFFSNL